MISTLQITMPVAVTPVAALDRNALCLRQSRPFPPQFFVGDDDDKRPLGGNLGCFPPSLTATPPPPPPTPPARVWNPPQ
ncbi:MAG: hypothetical protein J0L63_16120 [Anaerolineae bacterium]|nr:hypothetical protein [Anaerolineae bacterium]